MKPPPRTGRVVSGSDRSLDPRSAEGEWTPHLPGVVGACGALTATLPGAGEASGAERRHPGLRGPDRAVVRRPRHHRSRWHHHARSLRRRAAASRTRALRPSVGCRVARRERRERLCGAVRRSDASVLRGFDRSLSGRSGFWDRPHPYDVRAEDPQEFRLAILSATARIDGRLPRQPIWLVRVGNTAPTGLANR